MAHHLKAGPRNKVRPVLVRFANRQARNFALTCKGKLKDSPVFISEQLTKSASQLFYEARKLVRGHRLSASWTRNGQVMIKTTSTARGKLVKNMSELLLVCNGG